jgi:hypothetical protein
MASPVRTAGFFPHEAQRAYIAVAFFSISKWMIWMQCCGSFRTRA